jgi:hypothetical protein
LKNCALLIVRTSPDSGQETEVKADNVFIYLIPTWFYCGAREGAITTSTGFRMNEKGMFQLLHFLTARNDHELCPKSETIESIKNSMAHRGEDSLRAKKLRL